MAKPQNAAEVAANLFNELKTLFPKRADMFQALQDVHNLIQAKLQAVQQAQAEDMQTFLSKPDIATAFDAHASDNDSARAARRAARRAAEE